MKISRGIYVLPSLFTVANLAAGFVSIIWSIHHHYSAAAWAVMFALAMDIVDGRVARWTKSSSHFGIELDSLADLVSFGLAPAILMYQMVLHTMHRPGVAIALFFVVTGAMRLARFNTKAHEGETSVEFIGLPIPAAAGILASFVLSYQLFASGPEITAKTIPIIMKRMPFFFKTIPITMVLISFLMISNVPYMHAKKLKFNRPKSLQTVVLIITGALLVLTYPQNTIFILFLIYLLSGITEYLFRFFRLRRSLGLPLKFKRAGNGKMRQEKETDDLNLNEA